VKDKSEKVIIDYAPSLHGSFLSYVIGVYIYGQPKVENIFHSNGASHLMLPYEKKIKIEHYSSKGIKYDEDTDKIIYIQHDPNYNFIAFVNTLHRCHGNHDKLGKYFNKDNYNPEKVTSEKIRELHYNELSDIDINNNCDVRNQFYSKLQDDEFKNSLCIRKPTQLPVYNFDFKSFYTITNFLHELRQVADFMNLLFMYDNSLIVLYNKFIELNQGYQYYTKANYLLEHIYKGTDFHIEQNNFIHAYINYQIANIFNIYDGRLYEGAYPTNTIEINNIIIEKISKIKE